MSVQLSLVREELTASELVTDPPPGLEYHPQLLTAHDEAGLLAQIDGSESG